MQPAVLPVNEAQRVATLHGLDILDTPPEERFDRLTRIARRMFEVPIALVSLVDSQRQWFKSRTGVVARETPRDISFCSHAILGDDIMVVSDARYDPRFHDNPLVTGPPFVRFYAGCPLRIGESKIGTFCLIDDEPHTFGDAERRLLRDMAAMAEQEISALHLATTDELTTIANKRGFEALAEQSLRVCKRMQKPATLLFFDLDDFKLINDRYGHAEGDRALQTFSRALVQVFRDSDVIGRLGGDEFVVLLTGATGATADTVVPRMHETIKRFQAASGLGYRIGFSVGQTEFDPERHTGIAELLRDADTAMYDNKRRSKGSSRTATQR